MSLPQRRISCRCTARLACTLGLTGVLAIGGTLGTLALAPEHAYAASEETLAELRALQKKGEVAVIGALDDTQLAELTADAAQQIAKAPWKPYIALADTAVLTEEGTADA